MTARLAGLAATVVLVGGAAACSSSSKVGANATTLEFTITDAGCNPDTASAAPGSTKFHVKNTGANSVTEFEVLQGGSIVGEKENLSPGLEGEFTIDLKPGTYTVACPGGTQHPTGTLTVAGAGAPSSGAPSSASAETDHDMNADCVPTSSANAGATKVSATLSDFKIELNPATVAAGAIELDGTNTGQHPHEIVVVKGVAPSVMPTDANGAVDEDKLPPGAKLGELESFGPGRSCSAGFTLSSGTYTLFCNVQGAEEGAHFRDGMVTTLVVS